MSALPPKLGKYDIVRALGEGAMGTVYEAVDSVIERTVAIKTIRKSGLDADEAAEHSRRFLVEAKAAGKLNHPHIVSLYDYGDEAGLAYIVMELVQGRELQRYFDEKFVFSLGDVVRLMGELLDALGYSHRRGVVHRDVKPANIFVTDSGGVKLGDFGIARIESSQKTRAGGVVGTPSYMSPEQIRGEAADARSDLYAAGVVLFQFLTGERPYSGTMLAMALKVLNEPVPLPSSLKPGISPQLDAVVVRALAKTAAERFQSAAEFWQALATAVGLVVAPTPALAALAGSALSPSGEHTRNLLGGTGFGATTGFGRTAAAWPAPEMPPASPSPPAPAAVPVDAAADTARPAGRRGAWIAVAVLLVAGLVVAGWWMNAPRGTDPAAPPAQAPVLPDGRASGTAAGGERPAPPMPSPASAPSAPASVPVPVPVPAPSAALQTLPPAAAPAPAPPVQGSTAASATPPAAASTATAAKPALRPPESGTRKPVREAPVAAPRPAPPPASAPPAAPTAKVPRPARCSDILQRASLEPLSAEEGAFLRRECQ